MAGESSTAPTSTSAAPVATSSKDSDKLKKGLGTVFQTVKRALTIKKKTKPKASATAVAQPAQSSQPAQPAQPPSQPPIAVGKTESTAPPVPEKTEPPSSPPPKKPPTAPPVSKSRGTLGPPQMKSHTQRTIELFKKYGLEISEASFPRSDIPRAERVHKEIRMRVHRTCHRCNTGYGAERLCLSCGHRRCKQCPRFPVKGEKAKGKGKEKVGEKREVKPIVRRRRGETGLSIPSRTGGQDLVHKKIRQRVHRTCHRCQSDFGAEKVCSKCNHNRCNKCPRNPHKKNKPAGYYERDQSDSESEKPVHRRIPCTYKKIRQRVHWKCSKCSGVFQYGSKLCDSCGSRREETGIRDPLKKPKKSPLGSKSAIRSESYMQNLEERLMATSIA